MKTARLIAQNWLTTGGAIAQALGQATYNSAVLLALALQEPKPPRKKAEPKVPHEGTWWERSLGVRDE